MLPYTAFIVITLTTFFWNSCSTRFFIIAHGCLFVPFMINVLGLCSSLCFYVFQLKPTSCFHEKANNGVYASKAEERKILRRMKNGPGRKCYTGERVEKSVGFPPNSFDRVLLDAPCSALGLRPRLFSGEVVVL